MILQAIVVLGVSGFCFAGLLAFLSKKLYVEEDPKVAQIIEVLPGLNCGACGYSGCRAYAEAVVKGCTIFGGCLPGADEVNNEVSKIIGTVCAGSSKTQVVVCRCGADENQKKSSNVYKGPQTCRAAAITGGAIDCAFGCLSFGDCVKICPVSALSLENKKIKVDIEKCIGCGQCQKICPRNLFEMIPFSKNMHTTAVACSNKEKALAVKKVCSRGCIGCGLCARVENSPYSIEENLSSINYKLPLELNALLAGKNKCPTKCIDELHG
jgi:Na+-translocating ferredoxin:NAD+ oxidoreductase subunit B